MPVAAKKQSIDKTVETTWSIPFDEILAAYIPEAERQVPLAQWWATSSGEASNALIITRSVRTTVMMDEMREPEEPCINPDR